MVPTVNIFIENLKHIYIYIFQQNSMTFQVAVHGIKVVGMKFFGDKNKIPINIPCILEREINNCRDANAIVVIDRETNQKLAYIKKEHASILASLFDGRLVQLPVFLKAKEEPVFKNRYSGAVQNCNIAFYCKQENCDAVRNKLAGNFPLKFKHKI